MAWIKTLAACALTFVYPMTYAAAGWNLDGTKQVLLHSRGGDSIPIGTVNFSHAGDNIAFHLSINTNKMKSYFLSMRDFRCIDGEEVTCYVPYPYVNAGIIKAGDYSWLEHSFLFFTKSPREFGARMENGIYFAFKLTSEGLIGTPQRVDLNLIASPPEDLTVAPFSQVERRDEPAGARWIESISIEDIKPPAIVRPSDRPPTSPP